MDDPLATLLRSHDDLREQLAALDHAAAALAADPPGALAALAGVLAHLAGAGRRHIEDVEASVFPRVRSGAVDELAIGHRAIEAIQLALRDAVARAGAEHAGEVTAHGAALAAAWRRHLQAEEEQIFPLLAALDPAELRAIAIEMRLRRG